MGGFHSVYNGRIYYYDEYSQMNSMYPDGSDVREEPHMADSDYFSGNLRWSNRNTDNSICNIDLTTGKVTTVLSAPDYPNAYQVTNKYVYYYLNIPSKDENGKEKTVGEMWRCDHNGQNAEKLLTLDRGLRFFLVHGNYLYYISSRNENQSRIVRIHVETGEILYIE